MTVLGGARALPGALRLPGSAPAGARSGSRRAIGARPIAASERRRVGRRARAGRSHHVRTLIAAVIVLFLLGLVYLAQTKQLAAANYQIDQAILERDDLFRQVQTVETSVLRWGTEATALERGQRLGLDQLANRIRLADR